MGFPPNVHCFVLAVTHKHTTSWLLGLLAVPTQVVNSHKLMVLSVRSSKYGLWPWKTIDILVWQLVHCVHSARVAGSNWTPVMGFKNVSHNNLTNPTSSTLKGQKGLAHFRSI